MANSSSGDSMLERFVRILGAFDAGRTSMSVATLSRRADVPLATMYRLVDDMVRHGLLGRSADGQVRLGLRLWELTNRSSPALDLREAALPFMQDIQHVVRQHTQLSVLRDGEVLFLERLSSRGSVLNHATVAGRLPIHVSSSGLVLMSFSPRHVQEQWLTEHQKEAGGGSPAAADLRSRMAEIRRLGYCMLPGVVDADTTGLAVPVLGAGGHALAALGIVVGLGQENVRANVPALMTAARGISRAMGVRQELSGILIE